MLSMIISPGLLVLSSNRYGGQDSAGCGVGVWITSLSSSWGMGLLVCLSSSKHHMNRKFNCPGPNCPGPTAQCVPSCPMFTLCTVPICLEPPWDPWSDKETKFWVLNFVSLSFINVFVIINSSQWKAVTCDMVRRAVLSEIMGRVRPADSWDRFQAV